MGLFDQWGDKADDIAQEKARNNNRYQEEYRYNNHRHHTPRKNSGSFLNSVFKAIALLFIIWLIASIMK